MNVLFLDIDGVVNTLMIYKDPVDGKHNRKHEGYYFDLCYPSDLRVSNTQAVLWLDKICHDFNLKIVISSVWRYDYEAAVESLYNSGLSRDIEVIGKTPRLDSIRGDEIQAYLDEHPEIKKFVILDDDADMGHLIKYLVQTDIDAGINRGTLWRVGKVLDEEFNDLNSATRYHSIENFSEN